MRSALKPGGAVAYDPAGANRIRWAGATGLHAGTGAVPHPEAVLRKALNSEQPLGHRNHGVSTGVPRPGWSEPSGIS